MEWCAIMWSKMKERGALPLLRGLSIIILLGVALSVRPAWIGEPSPLGSDPLNSILRRSHMMSDWLFLQVLHRGGNPYDPEGLAEFGYLSGIEGYAVLARFSPPWYYLFFAPLGFLPPGWFLVCAFVLAALAVIRIFTLSLELAGVCKPTVTYIALALLLFPPVMFDVGAGQVSTLLSLALVNALWCDYKQRHLMVGFWLALLSVKPHSTYLLVLAFLLIALRHRNYQIIGGYIITVAVMVGAAFLAAPGLYKFWSLVATPTGSKTLTLATALREALLALTGTVYDWPIFGVSALSAGFLGYLALTRSLHGRRCLLVVLGASVITAPYGWFYDYTVLAPLFVATLVAALHRYQRGSRYPLLILLGLVLTTFLGIYLGFDLALLLYPAALLAMFVYVDRPASRAVAST